eukprot:TRINITY_DN159_c0_g1_i1.p1 TRINITY_DN159_c0_g1~~TRINITY_DN159_c0_g1_i1.p1  ORF type:complete len:78 (-),score=1.60 TRINITY_DN159_c0_g1_i1:5-238(-)
MSSYLTIFRSVLNSKSSLLSIVNNQTVNLFTRRGLSPVGKKGKSARLNSKIKAKYKRRRKQKLGWNKKSPNRNKQPF